MVEQAASTAATEAGLNDLIDSGAVGYAGDVSPEQCYAHLKHFDDSTLIDVRTQAEWQFVGVPDLRSIEHELELVSWKHYPAMNNNEQFAQQLEASAPDKDAPLFFLCRSGGRSLDAAICATELGYKHCFNVAGGFEGEPDGTAKRGTRSGWKAASLPWYQT